MLKLLIVVAIIALAALYAKNKGWIDWGIN
jgi:hypothetical protein